MNKIGLRKLNDVSKKYKQLLLEDIDNGKILLEDVEQCICCQNKNFEKLLDVDRFDLPFGSYICQDCGLVSTSPRIRQKSLPYYYEKYYHHLNYGKESLDNQGALFHKGQGKKIFNKLKPYITNKNILDILEIGAGVGNVLDEFRIEASLNDIEVSLFGTEYSPECIIQCEKRNLQMIEGNSESVLTLNKKFDIIILSHVFEHFIDLENELSILKKLLKKDGLLYIEVPGILKNHDKVYYDFSFLGYSVHAHIYNFSLITLVNIVEQHGYTLKEGNEEVEAIFQYTTNKKYQIQNDTLRIKMYLEFLEDNQSFALKQKERIVQQEVMLKNRDDGIVRLKEKITQQEVMLKNRDDGIVRLKEKITQQEVMLKNRDDDIARLKEKITQQELILNSKYSLFKLLLSGQ